MRCTKQNAFWGSSSLLLCLFVLSGFNVESSVAQQAKKTMACYFAASVHYNFSGAFIDPFLCTHIIQADGIVTPDGVKINFTVDVEQLKAITKLKQENPSLAVMISLGHEFPSVVDQSLEAVVMRFATNAVLLLEKLNLDGLDLDWEFPQSFEKLNFIRFIKILSAYLHSSNLLLSLALPASPFRIDNGYDIDTLNKYFDFITVMNYDYHHYDTHSDTVTGYNSPLYTPKGETMYQSTAATLTYLLYRGLSKDKILMGIPTYGISWTLANPDNHGLHSPAVGQGVHAPYSNNTGIYLYPDVCLAQKQGAVTVIDEENVGEYLYNGTTWVAFEGTYTIPKKIQWVHKVELAGIGIWAFQLDDLYNVCGQGSTPLLRLMKDNLQNPNTLYFSPEH